VGIDNKMLQFSFASVISTRYQS